MFFQYRIGFAFLPSGALLSYVKQLLIGHRMRLCDVYSSAKHQRKSNAVDQLLSPVHAEGEWTSNDPTLHVLPTPREFSLRRGVQT